MLLAAALLTWKLAVKRTLCIVASISAVTLGSVCQLPSVVIVATNEKPAPADAMLLDPVQSVPVYDFAVSTTWTTSLAAVRYANRNVCINVLDGTTMQSLCAWAIVFDGFESAKLNEPVFACVPSQSA
jgi:hypothetical protein